MEATVFIVAAILTAAFGGPIWAVVVLAVIGAAIAGIQL
jgi:hypothetical protein